MRIAFLLGLVLALLAVLGTTGYVLADISADFHESDGDLFDDWDVCRTRSFGEDGFYQITETSFRPAIAFESLGERASQAYSLGARIAAEYPDEVQRAEAIFRFVRDRVNYTPDVDQFDRDEFAQNADEMAVAITENGVGYGDCEDSAVLLAVMYQGAGYRSAIVVAPGHTAALVYLPGYKKATTAFELKGEPGWVWAEATGRNNPLGWVPKEFIGVKMAGYEITEEAVVPAQPPEAPSVVIGESGDGGGFSGFFLPFPFFGVFAFLWLISLSRRRRA